MRRSFLMKNLFWRDYYNKPDNCETGSGEEEYGMQLIEKIEPPLPAGRVCVKAGQNVRVTEAGGKVTDDYVEASKDFYVRSRAFTMDSADVYSVSPGNQAGGNFADELPHITLKNKTLPWEYKTASGDPWVALLAFAETECEEKDITIAELMKSAEKNLYFPVSAQPGEYLENDSDLCHVIELDKKLFQKTAPRKGERAVLTHAKFLDLLQKTDETVRIDGYFSTVIGNRFVPSSASETVKSTIHLVSMLGYDEPDKLSTNCSKVRLVSLYRWSVFSRSDEEAGFTGLMSGIKSGVLQIDVGNERLRHGYVPKRHLFRSGESTVSFYRGPLSPCPVPRIEAFGRFEEGSAPVSADGALIFDRENAVFDASYAAAWQMGRLLTVQNKAIAADIAKWRKNVETTFRQYDAAVFMDAKMDGCYSPGVLAMEATETFVDVFRNTKTCQSKCMSGRMKRWEPDSRITYGRCSAFLEEKIYAKGARENIGEHFSILYPEQIRDWIAQLKLLKGVPLAALVGDEAQLPPESVRFFYLDENWTDQMINGALSIGAGNEKSRSINDSFLEDFHLAGRQNIHGPRRSCIHENQRRFYTQNAGALEEGGQITGFLMRSRLVRLWKGLESSAFDQKGKRLDILRMEQLSGEIMICLFQGEIARLEVREPKEGLRFGAPEHDRNICVRDVKKGNEGRPISGKKVRIRADECGRADILPLAKEFKGQLGVSEFTSAHFAMELIVAPGLAEFNRQ